MRIISIFVLVSLVFVGQLFAQEDENLIIKNPDVAASYPGGLKAYEEFIKSNLIYPNSALRDTLEGEVIIGFVVEKDGSSSYLHIVENIGKGCGIEAARVIKMIPKWTPAVFNNEPVRTYYYAKVNFDMPLDYVVNEIVNEAGDVVEGVVIDEEPEFPGGNNAFGMHIMRNIRYPDLAMESDISGKVYLKFKVQKDGEISDIEIIRGIGGGCDLEAVRVIAKSPKWKPGTQDGKPVNVWYTVPISFKLQ